jgi:hypothetical protein
MFPDVPVIDRPGIISAWDDPKFVAAIEKTRRRNLLTAGVTIDVCLGLRRHASVQPGFLAASLIAVEILQSTQIHVLHSVLSLL